MAVDKKPREGAVEITHCESPSCFFVRKSSMVKDLEKVYAIIEDAQTSPLLLKPENNESGQENGEMLAENGETHESDGEEILRRFGIMKKQMVLAKCRRFPDVAFHRGVVQEANCNSLLGVHFRILFVDYGSEQWVHHEDTREAPKGLISIPPLSLRCCLNQCFPPANGVDKEPIWSSEAIEYFKRLTCEDELTLKVFNTDDEICQVDLLLWSKDEREPSSLRDLLVLEEIACLDDGRNFVHEEQEVLDPVLPAIDIPVNSSMQVRISFVESPDEIYVNPLPLVGKKSEILNGFHSELNRYYSSLRKSSSIHEPHEGMAYVIRSKIDGNFYRGLVERIPRYTRLSQVLLIDVGRREICGPKDMFSLTQKFEYGYPFRFTICVAMDNLRPRSSRTGWDDKCREFLEAKKNTRLLMHVVEPPLERQEGIFELDIVEAEIFVALFETNKDLTCLASKMVAEQLARFNQTYEKTEKDDCCRVYCRHPGTEALARDLKALVAYE